MQPVQFLLKSIVSHLFPTFIKSIIVYPLINSHKPSKVLLEFIFEIKNLQILVFSQALACSIPCKIPSVIQSVLISQNKRLPSLTFRDWLLAGAEPHSRKFRCLLSCSTLIPFTLDCPHTLQKTQ